MLGAKILFGTLTIVVAILVMSMVAELRGLVHRVDALETALPSKSELAMLRPMRIGLILEQNCATCHTIQAFPKTREQSHYQLLKFVDEHRALPGAEVIAEDEVELSTAAMIAVRCMVCHDEEVTGQVALMSRVHREKYLRAKLIEVRSVFRPEEIHDLMFAFDVLLGEPRRDPERPGG
jgi:cytochrome c553